MTNIDQLETSLNELEVVGNKFFDKIVGTIVAPYSFDEFLKEKDNITRILVELDSNLQQSHLGASSEQQPIDSIQKLKEGSEQQLRTMHQNSMRIQKNVERVRSSLQK